MRILRAAFGLCLALALSAAGGFGAALWYTSAGRATSHWLAVSDARPGRTDAVDREQLERIVRELTAGELQGRRSGERGGQLAADYLAEAFRTLGLSPLGGDSHRQAFSFPYYAHSEPYGASLTYGGKSYHLVYRHDYRFQAFSGHGQLEADLVYVGRGTPAEYAGRVLTGQWALIRITRRPDFHTAQAMAATARAMGAGGVAFLLDDSSWLARADGSQQIIPGFPAIALAARTLTDLAPEKGPPDNWQLGATGFRLAAQVGVIAEARRGENILGILEPEGGRPPTLTVLIGAHYDHLGQDLDGGTFPGAFDNASGCAILLEVARVLRADPLPLRLIFAAWGAEEVGLHGSAHFADTGSGPRPDLVINLDSLGGPGELIIGYNERALSSALDLAQAAAAQGRNYRLVASTAGSDGHSFARAGFPVIYLHESPAPIEHTLDDTADKLSYGSLAAVTSALIKTLETLVEEKEHSETGVARSAHFLVSGPTSAALPLAWLEEIYAKLTDWFVAEPPAPVRLYLTGGAAAQRDQARLLCPELTGNVADAWVHYESNSILLNLRAMDHDTTRRALVHELAHLFIAANTTRLGSGDWQNEYIAAYLEAELAGGVTASGPVLTWATLAAGSAPRTELNAQGGLVYRYLSEQYGRERLRELWRALFRGEEWSRALAKLYPATPAQLEEAWVVWYRGR